MRYLILFGILVMMVGCVGQEVIPLEPPFEQPEKECTNVTEEIPVTHEECTNISYTEEVCERRALAYTSVEPPIVHLCVADGPCVGSLLSECPFCAKAMTRCMMVITNEDSKRGTWKVGAKFTLGKSGFIKDPITATIEPNESATFDFQQIYVPPKPISSASCELYMVEEPVIDDCHQETRTKRECTDVTSYVTTVREVCE